MRKILVIFIFTCFLIFTLSSCTEENNSPASSDSAYSKVIISINPLKDIAEEIGRGVVDFNTFVPSGVELHDYEPRVNDVKVLEDYNAIIYNGLNMEPWLDKVMETSSKELEMYALSDGYDVIDEHGILDPHIWLGVSGGLYYGEMIKDALVKEDPDNKEAYESNYEIFQGKCNELLTKYKDLFSKLSNKNIVTGHEAFNYLARDFGLIPHSIENIFSAGEPNAKTLSDLVDYCKENDVKVIFGEEMASKDVADTLAKEVGAEVLVIDTLEFEQEGSPGYIRRMESNLELIYQGLSKN